MKRKMQFLLHSIIITAIFIVYFTSCSTETVIGKGEPEDFEYKVSNYIGIRIDGHFEIRYYSAPSDTVTLTIHPNLHEYYIVEEKNGVLLVRTKKRTNINSVKTPILTVSTPILNHITLNGAVNLITYDKIAGDSFSVNANGASNSIVEVDVESLTVGISGASKIEFSGKTKNSHFKMSGASELNAFTLQANDTTINLSGTGAIKVNTLESLNVNASGASSIEYRGSPNLNLKTSGLSSVKQVN